MDTRRALLDALADGPVPGPALADRLEISRAAVWKHVEGLREGGFEIDSTDDGYEIRHVPEFGGDAVAYGLDASYSIEYHETIGSTNERARELAIDGARDVVVLADEQTGGRGRLNREWAAPAGGIWLSVVLRPDVPPAHAPLFTLAAAVATVRAIRECGVDAHIKWPNDVLVGSEGGRGGQKLAGILTEMEGEADRISWLVVGIGVNANVDAETLPSGATSLRACAGDVERRVFTHRLLESFAELHESPEEIIPEWRRYTSTLGKRVRVVTPTEHLEGDAIDVSFPGGLVLRTAEGERTVHAGDCEHLRTTAKNDDCE